MTVEPVLPRRVGPVLRPDPTRVIAKLFLPGQEILADGRSRADAVLGRILAIPEERVDGLLKATLTQFGARHRHLADTLVDHFSRVEGRLPAADGVSPARRQLIGAYFTQEYSVEAAALFNPSMVAHPDQSGLAAGEVRFLLSVRAVGEGHISSIEFRTGTFRPPDALTIDDPGSTLDTGRVTATRLRRDFVRAALAEQADTAALDHILGLVPVDFSADDLHQAATNSRDETVSGNADEIVQKVQRIAACNYRREFSAERPLSERVLIPSGPDESRGMEDARFTRFTEADGRVTYYATYTAYDGFEIAPHLLQTDDFLAFTVSQLVGPAAKNKGMALFPRRIDGRFVALTRWDRESNAVATSADGRDWGGAQNIQTPARAWELIQVGNCGPPIETAHGWLVLTHGVGPMRTYGVGALLLDLDDPNRVVGALEQPLLTPAADERDGYVPNVIYSCGALLHGGTLVIPYGCSDSSIRFAVVDADELLARLMTQPG